MRSCKKGFGSLTDAVKPLMNAAEIFIAGEKPALSDDAVSVVVPDAVTYLPLEDLVDFEQETRTSEKEEEKLKKKLKEPKACFQMKNL